MCNKLAFAIYLILECKNSAISAVTKFRKAEECALEIAICNYCRYQSTFTTPCDIFEAATTTCFTEFKKTQQYWEIG